MQLGRAAGYTLVEMMIATGLLGMSAAAITAYLNYNENQAVSLNSRNSFAQLRTSTMTALSDTQNCAASLALPPSQPLAVDPVNPGSPPQNLQLPKSLAVDVVQPFIIAPAKTHASLTSFANTEGGAVKYSYNLVFPSLNPGGQGEKPEQYFPSGLTLDFPVSRYRAILQVVMTRKSGTQLIGNIPLNLEFAIQPNGSAVFQKCTANPEDTDDVLAAPVGKAVTKNQTTPNTTDLPTGPGNTVRDCIANGGTAFPSSAGLICRMPYLYAVGTGFEDQSGAVPNPTKFYNPCSGNFKQFQNFTASSPQSNGADSCSGTSRYMSNWHGLQAFGGQFPEGNGYRSKAQPSFSFNWTDFGLAFASSYFGGVLGGVAFDAIFTGMSDLEIGVSIVGLILGGPILFAVLDGIFSGAAAKTIKDTSTLNRSLTDATEGARTLRILRSQNGSVIMQVVLLSAAAILVIGYTSSKIQNTLKQSSTLQSAAGIQERVLLARFALSKTNACSFNLQPTKSLKPLTTNPKGQVPVNVIDPWLNLPEPGQKKGNTILSSNAMFLDEAQYEPTVITNVTPFGRSNVPNSNWNVPDVSAATSGSLPQYYLADIVVSATRTSSNGKSLIAYGSKTITQNIPILLSLDPNTGDIQMCSTRQAYLQTLGPPGTPPPLKSSVECLDRGGTPAQVTVGGNTYWDCQFTIAGDLGDTSCVAADQSPYKYHQVVGLPAEGWQADVPAIQTLYPFYPNIDPSWQTANPMLYNTMMKYKANSPSITFAPMRYCY